MSEGDLRGTDMIDFWPLGRMVKEHEATDFFECRIYHCGLDSSTIEASSWIRPNSPYSVEYLLLSKTMVYM